MDTTIIKFNRPLLIAVDKTDNDYIYKVYYGFIINSNGIEYPPKLIEKYVEYLCMMGAISNGDQNFSLNFKKVGTEFIDKKGKIHPVQSALAKEYGKKSRERLNLSFDIQHKKIDEETSARYIEEEHFIVSEYFFDLQ